MMDRIKGSSHDTDAKRTSRLGHALRLASFLGDTLALLNRFGQLQLANILPRPAPIVGLRNAISELSANGAETQGGTQGTTSALSGIQSASGSPQRRCRFPEPGRQQARRRQAGHEVSDPLTQRLQEDGLSRPSQLRAQDDVERAEQTATASDEVSERIQARVPDTARLPVP